jgi:uncharacterized SAM-binding protein YcdF (DUF218 family)
MSVSWFLTNAFASLLLPPMSLLLLGVLGVWIARRFRRVGHALIAIAAMLLVGLSIPVGSRLLVEPLERRSLPVADPKESGAQAIVVLGGGRRYFAPEDGQRHQPSEATLVRLRHAARLHRLTKLPVLVSGGAPDGHGESEAEVMARSLKEDFGVPVRWLESTSDNTAQNALHASLILQKEGIVRILLVTDALHMPRSERSFLQAGFGVVPAPTGFIATRPLDAGSFIPGARSLRDSYYALHEWIGLLWYRLRGAFA